VRLDDWGRPIPTFVLAADRDTMVSLDSLCGLYGELPSPKRFLVMKNASHFHCAEDAQERYESAFAAWKASSFDPRIDFETLAAGALSFSDLDPAAHGASTARALYLAHMDEHLKGSVPAREFLDGDLVARFASKGVDLEVSHLMEEVAA
jgi:hypothetical protein